MKNFKFVFYTCLIIALLFGSFVDVSNVQASARTISWVVSITYQNVDTVPGTVSVAFYPEGSTTPVVFDPLNGGEIQPGAGASLYVGSVTGLSTGFVGSAVMLSNARLVATAVQFHQNTGTEKVKMRILSNGFRAEDASNQYLIATALANTYQRTNVFSIQNVESETITATIKFYQSSNGALASTVAYDIPAQSTKYIEMDKTADTGLGSTVFNGSAIVTAVLKSNPATNAKVVASVNEYYTTKDVASAFEGIPLSRASQTLYMATGLCEMYGLDSFYAVQNASLTDTTEITVTYYTTSGVEKAVDGPYTLGPGQKKSIITCSPSSGTDMTEFTGSAVITSTVSPVAAIGRAQLSILEPRPGQEDMFTAFLGEPQGYSKLALPFIRYANDTNYNAVSNLGGKQRAFLAIQNLESTSAKVDVEYYDKNGVKVATHTLTIASKAKANSNASMAGALGVSGMVAGEFGYYLDGSFGGAVIIRANSENPTAKFIAIARVQNPGAGEDYNAVPVQ